jgi:putative transposase
MKTTRFTESQMIAVLKQGDAGIPVKDICRQAGISQATYYQWKSKYGGMDPVVTCHQWSLKSGTL